MIGDGKALATFLVIASLLSGCATLGLTKATESNFRTVKVGTTSSDVKAKLGSPDNLTASQDSEVWNYRILSQTRDSYYPYRLTFKKGVLQKVEFDTNSAEIPLQKVRDNTDESTPAWTVKTDDTRRKTADSMPKLR